MSTDPPFTHLRQLNVRLTEAEREAAKNAAYDARMPLNTWLRKVIGEAVEKENSK